MSTRTIARNHEKTAGQECPECTHDRGKPYYSPWAPLLSKLGHAARMSPADCRWHIDPEADPCGCSHPFHGS